MGGEESQRRAEGCSSTSGVGRLIDRQRIIQTKPVDNWCVTYKGAIGATARLEVARNFDRKWRGTSAGSGEELRLEVARNFDWKWGGTLAGSEEELRPGVGRNFSRKWGETLAGSGEAVGSAERSFVTLGSTKGYREETDANKSNTE